MFSQKDLRARQQMWMRRICLAGISLLAAWRLFPHLFSLLRGGAGALLNILFLAAYLFVVIAFPLIVFALLRFAYSVFARPYLRLWRIRRKRNARELIELAKRGQ